MKSRDWFVVGLRLFGVWLLLQGLSEAIVGAEVRLGMFTLKSTTESVYWFHGGVDLIAGLTLLIYARFFAGLVDWHFTRPHECEKCGYDLRETPDKCPECGNVPTGSV